MTDLVVLLGHRIGYSASPAMHNAAFATLGMDARYELADVDPASLTEAVAEMSQNVVGAGHRPLARVETGVLGADAGMIGVALIAGAVNP